LEKIQSYRGNHNKLGFAYQLIYVRLLNYFPKQKPFEIIDEILSFAAMQMGINKKEITSYLKHRQHISRHQEQIREYLRLKSFNVSDQLCQFLLEEAHRVEQITLLLSEAKRFLKDNKSLHPSDDTLERLIVTQREKARQQIFSKLDKIINDDIREKLDGLLKINDGRSSKLQYLKNPPSVPSPKSLLKLVKKLTIIQETQILEIDITWINNNYQRSLAKYAQRCSAHRLRELKPLHRYTVLTCFLWQVSRDTLDYMIDMHSKIMTKVYSGAENQIDEEVKKNKKNIKKSLSMLKTIGTTLLDNDIADADLRKMIFKQIKKDELKNQIMESEPLLTGKFSHVFNVVITKFNYLRQFAPALLAHLKFETESKQTNALLKAVNILHDMNDNNKRRLPHDVPIGFIPSKLKNMVMPNGHIDRKAWECALLTAIRDEIKSGNLSVKGSKRYGQFNDFFMPDNEWKVIRHDFFKRARLPYKHSEIPAYLKKRLNLAYDKFFASEATNEYAKIENDAWALSVDPAESFTKDETIALEKLKSWLSSRMRPIKLPQLLIEVDNDLLFTKEFLLPDNQSKRVADEIRAILVTLMAHGCFIGPYTMARLTQGVTYKQIQSITDWQLTEDAQRLALAIIVNAISKLDVSKQWGLGKTSTSDGQRFEYRRKSLRQTYSTKFGDFALEFYTFVADNYAPYYSTPIECTERDAPYVLDGILYNESDLDIEEHYSDTHGFMEINFTAFAMVGKKFSPRIKGVQRQRIYRIDKRKNYGSLTPLVKSNDRLIHMDWIVDQWNRMGQFYASLERGCVTASTALKRLAGFDNKNHFYRANRELGRILKTENILEYMSDPLLRQNRRRGLLKGEQIHQLARDVAYGKRGKISVRDLHEQKNTCSCLTLILACIIYWQAKEINRIINECGDQLDPACLAMLPHVSPIGWDNVILYGEYVVDKRLIK
jgi:TnpA family transposase